MSTALGIASVSVVLVDLLNNGLIDHDVGTTVGGRVTVSALPPDRVLSPNGKENTQLNLFLYHVTPNIGWHNAGLPSRNDRGERIGNPPLAVNLHYMLTAYGEKDFYSEVILGYAMQLFHEHPVLSRAEIAKALSAPTPALPSSLPPSLGDLAKSELADQVELIKITPEPLSTEEMSKLWAAFQTHYRSTAAYEASVVLIESKESARASLPVRGRNVYVRTLRRPLVESVVSNLGDDLAILADSTILVRGKRLMGDITVLRLGDEEVAPQPEDISDTEISVSLAGVTLRAGAQGVQVVHKQLMGTPPQQHRGVESNLAPFLLAPSIDSAINKNLSPAGTGFSKGTISFDVVPDVAPGQRVVLVLNQLVPPGAPEDAVAAAYSFQAAPRTANETTVSFAVDGVADGTYLVRVQVDGAESPLEPDDMTGRYDKPKVVIP